MLALFQANGHTSGYLVVAQTSPAYSLKRIMKGFCVRDGGRMEEKDYKKKKRTRILLGIV